MRNTYTTPILFLIFNRPDTTKRVFEAIRKYKPTKLFVAGDGPRENKPSEKERCEEARKITENIDWPCETKRLYRKENLGCKYAVSGAIDWFFKNVEEGIILEDDCLPDPSFFTFCEKMLDIYRNDKQVMHVSGDNFLPADMQNRNDYLFSKYIYIWGWATWRRAWKNYDVCIKDWPKIKRKGTINKYFDNLLEKIYWQTLFDAVYRGKINTWDYQFVYHVWKNGGVSAIPGKNLVSNIGFGENAVHLKSGKSPFSRLETGTININIRRKDIKIRNFADIYSRKNVYGISLMNILKHVLYYLFLV